MGKVALLMKRKAYRNMFLNILVLTSVVIMIVCSVLYVLFSRSSVKEIATVSNAMLSQTSYIASIVDEQVRTIGNQLINDHEITNALFSTEVDRIEEYHVISKLKNYQAVYTFIDHIGIYNEFNGRYMNSKGIKAEDERRLLGDMDRLRRLSFSNLFPRTIRGWDDKDIQLLTFVLNPGHQSFFPTKGAIVINMKVSYLASLLEELKSESSSFLVVADADGTILGGSDESMFLRRDIDQPYMKRIVASGRPSGSFVTDVAGEKSLVSYVRSGNLDWYFISVNRYAELLQNLKRLQHIVYVLAGVMLGASCLIIWLMTNRMYEPLDKLLRFIGAHAHAAGQRKPVNEYTVLREAFRSMTEQTKQVGSALAEARKSQLLQYMKGAVSDAPAERFDGPHYQVALLKIDYYDRFLAANNDKMQSVIRYAIGNIAEELTGTECLVVEEKELAFVRQSREHAPEDITPLLLQLKHHLKSFFKLSVTIAVGGMFDERTGIRESYHQAKQLLRYRFLDGVGRIYPSSYVRNETASGAAGDSAAELRIAQAVYAGSGEEAAEHIRRFIEEAKRLPYDLALKSVNQLLSGLFQQFNTGSSTSREEAHKFIEMAYSFMRCETIDEAGERIIDICSALNDRLASRARNRHEETVEQIKSLLYQDYSNPNLSLDLIAERLHLTSGYVGKLFKNHTGVSFGDYLKQVRLDKASELLIETQMLTGDIGEAVGIYNTTYFYTLFKKRFGISPAQYRADSIRSRSAAEEPSKQKQAKPSSPQGRISASAKPSIQGER